MKMIFSREASELVRPGLDVQSVTGRHVTARQGKRTYLRRCAVHQDAVKHGMPSCPPPGLG